MSSQQENRPKRSTSFRQRFRPHVLPSLASVGGSHSTRNNSHSRHFSSSTVQSDAQTEAGLLPNLLRKRTLRKMPKANNLSISVPGGVLLAKDARSGLASPHTPHTPHTPITSLSPSNGINGEQARAVKQAQYGEGYDNHIQSPINALPPPPSPKSPISKTAKIFGNKLASRSASKLSKAESPPPMPGQAQADGSITTKVYPNHTYNKSSPDIIHPYSGPSSPDAVEFSHGQQNDGLQDSSAGKDRSNRKTQHKFGNFLNRKSSLRGDEPLPHPAHTTTREKPKPGPIKAVTTQPIDLPMRTAPIEKERGFRSAMNSALRNRSLDRMEDERGSQPPSAQQAYRPSQLGSNGLPAHHGGGSLVSNLRSGSTKAAEGISKARKGLFGGFKLNRSGSSHEREPITKEPYELRVLILPLEEQARITRISKRLHYCKEFWLPAFPYRCIDYLSDRGTYSEGLYRVPGSELEIKHYMARFDREYDIDLFDQKDLHDVNVVATMLKRWLSNLPPVLAPEIQSDIIRNCSEASPAVPGGSTPEYMKQKLSELPPWNYYLLFAITGHISFLHNHREQNKMTYENLFRCFATRALQVEPYIFWWLVWDWRNCWLGCAKEDEYKTKEYSFLESEKLDREFSSNSNQQKPPGSSASNGSKPRSEKPRAASSRQGSATKKSSGTERPQTAHTHVERERRENREKEREQRNLSSSESSKPSITTSTTGRSTSPVHEEEEKRRKEIPVPVLSPMQPLSPIENF